MGVRQPLFEEAKVRSKPHGEQQFRLSWGTEKECTLWLYWSLAVCCVQKGSGAPAHLLPSCSHRHTPAKQGKHESSRHRRRFWFSSSQSPNPVCSLEAKSKLTGYLSRPHRWSSGVTQHLHSAKSWGHGHHAMKVWLNRSERAIELELYLTTWEILEQQSTQADAYIKKRWKKKPGLSSWNHKKWELELSSCLRKTNQGYLGDHSKDSSVSKRKIAA